MGRKKRVLAVAYGGGHIQMLIPVVRELKRREFDVTLLALTIGGPVAAAAGIPYKAYRDYWNEVGVDAALEYGSRACV